MKNLKHLLAEKCESFCQTFLPNGVPKGNHWELGDSSGAPGKSLKVTLNGDMAGRWHDFASGEGGDLIDLYMQTKGLTFIEASKACAEWLGISFEAAKFSGQRKSYASVERLDVRRPTGEVLDWLLGRGLTPETVHRFKLGAQGQCVYFPCIDLDGNLTNYKSRHIREKSRQSQSPGAKPILFGWQAFSGKTSRLIITEGEIDAMSLSQVGIDAVSVPCGANNLDWIAAEWQVLQLYDDIVLCFDNDEPGIKGAKEAANRIGASRCSLCVFPGVKDANEYLMGGATAEQFQAALANAKPFRPDELVSSGDCVEELLALVETDQSDYAKILLGHEVGGIALRPGDVSLWTGVNGHGKSLLLGQVLLGLMMKGEVCCVYSAELTCGRQLFRLARQMLGTVNLSKSQLTRVAEKLEGLYYSVNTGGIDDKAISIARLIEVFEYAARRFGASHFVVDSLMTTDVPEDGEGALSKQRAALNSLSLFAKKVGGHVHIVAHPRKLKDENSPPNKMDICGSGKLTDRADNVFAVWSAGFESPNENPDGALVLLKQRNGDLQKKTFDLWLDRKSTQFSIDKDVVFDSDYAKALLDISPNRSDGIATQKVKPGDFF